MKNFTVKLCSSILLFIGLCGIVSVAAQAPTDTSFVNPLNAEPVPANPFGNNPFQSDPFGGDPFGGMIDSSLTIPPLEATQPTPTPKPATSAISSSQPSVHENTAPATSGTLKSNESAESSRKAELPFSSALSRESPSVPNEPSSFQNAIIEGVQLTAEKSETTDEKIISCYFIFRDKPSMYFYDIKVREKKLIFEFTDTKVGSSPVPTASELPIKGFSIESGKFDANKEVRGLTPEWHDRIRVIFDLEAVPKIHVNDEYSIISFSFKWATDPSKLKPYIVKDNSRKVIIMSTAGIGGAALGALAWFVFKPVDPPQKDEPIPFDDLPDHKINLK